MVARSCRSAGSPAAAPPPSCAASGRAQIGAGATGPGAALWVEVTEVAESEPTETTKALAAEYKKLLLAMLQRREAWQIIDSSTS